MANNLVSCYDSKRILTFYHEARTLAEDKMPIPRRCLLYPSRGCTHNCFYCSDRWENKTIKKPFMPAEELLKLPLRLKNFGTESIEMCGGGEPLLHPAINDFIKESVRLGLRLASISNGTMVRAETADLVAKHFSYIRLSLDSFNPEIYKVVRRPKQIRFELSQVLENAKNLIALKKKYKTDIQIGSKVCLTRENIFDIKETVEYAKNFGFDSIQIKVARKTGRKEMPEELLKKAGEDIAFCKENNKDFVVLGSVGKDTIDHKCWLCPLHIFIDTDGSVRNCCYFQFREKRHTFGNIFKNTLEEIWYSKKHLESVANIKMAECNKWDCKYFIYNKIMKEGLLEDKGQWQFE